MPEFQLCPHRNKLYFKIYSIENSYFNISQYYSFYSIFDQINAALVSIRDLSLIF